MLPIIQSQYPVLHSGGHAYFNSLASQEGIVAAQAEDVVASIWLRQIVGPTTAALGYRRGTPPAMTKVVAVRGNTRMSRRILRPFPQVGRMAPTLPGAPPSSGRVMPHPPIDLL